MKKIKELILGAVSYRTAENIRNALCFAVYYSGIGWLLTRGRKLGPAILLYHSIGGKNAFWDSVLDRQTFFDQLKFLVKTRTVVSLASLVERLRAGQKLDDDLVVLTFDDGYRDYVQTVVPMAEDFKVPTTLFIPTDVLSGKFDLFIDILNDIVEMPSSAHPDPDALEAVVGPASGSPDRKKDHALRYVMTLRTLDTDRRDKAVRDIIRASGWDQRTVSDRYVSPEDLRKCGSLSRFGTHSMSHSNLAALEPDRAEKEISGSKKVLEDVLGDVVDLFAYPYGKPWSFNEAVRKAVEQAGYMGAVTTVFGQVTPDSDPFALPRIDARGSLSRLKLNLMGLDI